MSRIVSIAALFLLTGCFIQDQFSPKPEAKASASAPLGTAAANTAAAGAKLEDAATKIIAKDKANVEAAVDANSGTIESPGKARVDGELGIVLARHETVPADPEESAAAQARKVLFEAGKRAEAEQAVAEGKASARQQSEEIGRLKQERDAAVASEAAARAKFVADLEANRIENEKRARERDVAHAAELQKVRDAERKEMVRKITWGLIIGSVAAAILGAFLAYGKAQTAEPGKAIIAVAFFGGASAFLATAAWAINQPWFKWFVIAGLSCGLIAGVVYIVTEIRSAKEKKLKVATLNERASQADEAEGALKRIIKTVDSLGENATIKDVRAKMGDEMNDNHKALIHELRAETKRGTAS